MNPSSPLPDLSRLCIHTITTQSWPLEESSERFAKAGVKGITVWRDALAGRDPAQAGRRIRDLGLSIVSLCRGGFFTHADPAARRAGIGAWRGRQLAGGRHLNSICEVVSERRYRPVQSAAVKRECSSGKRVYEGAIDSPK